MIYFVRPFLAESSVMMTLMIKRTSRAKNIGRFMSIIPNTRQDILSYHKTLIIDLHKLLKYNSGGNAFELAFDKNKAFKWYFV